MFLYTNCNELFSMIVTRDLFTALTSYSLLHYTEILATTGILPTTVGSRSTNTALGTCLPAPVSEKNVLKESSPPPMVLSDGI